MSSSIVKSVAQQLGQLLVEEAKSLYNVRDKIESLQMELKWMECFLRDADSKQHEEEVVCMWVSQVRDLAYDAEDTIERYLHEVSYHRRDGIRNTLKWFSHISCNCDALTLHKLGSEIDGLTFKLTELTSRMQRYGIKPTGILDYKIRIMEKRRTYSHTEEDVVGLDKDIQKVVNQLVEGDVKVVSISGTGGLGKTTLARKVFKHKDVKYHFNDNCAWVYISKEFEKGNIFKQILSELGKGEEAKQRKVEQLPGELHKLLQEKKCLIILDDIWNEEAWKRLKPALESIFTTTSSSKILFTTRNLGLLQQIDTSGSSGYPHLLNPLSLEESWKLLKRKAFIGYHGRTVSAVPYGYLHRLKHLRLNDIWGLLTRRALVGHGRSGGEPLTQGQDEISENEPQGGGSLNNKQYETNEDGLQDDDRVENEDEMENLGKEMLKHCGGLPIAIVALGGILSTRKKISEWKDIKNNLSSYLMSDTTQGGGDDNPILEVLELSYHDLPYYLKPCFLYLGIFPEDYKISTTRLYHLWEAEGFLVIEGAANKNGRTIYDVGERYLNELVQRSMVQVGECWPSGKIKTCRVHDVMRDMCLRKCEEVRFLNYIECSRSDPASTLPAVSVEVNRLRRCALNDENGDFVDKHFKHGERATGLRSLLVFQYQKMSGKVWKCFPLLRVLHVEGIRLDNIDGVGQLIHLRYLSLRKLCIEVVPSCLYNLKYVETLDLRVSNWSIKLLNKFDKMKKLRHLYLPRYVLRVEGGEKLKFPIGGQMETLKNFDPEKCETSMLMQMTNLRVFSIRKNATFEKGEEVKGVLEAPVMKNEGQLVNSFRLRIRGNVIKEEPEILSSAAHHPCFMELIISGNSKTSIRGVVFPERLTRVAIWNCEIGEGDGVLLSLEKLPHLKSLIIDRGVGKKLSISGGSFPQLTDLSLFRQTEWEECEVGEGALPLLQSLKLSGCMKLNKVNNLPVSLTTVELFQCEIGEGGVGLLLALEKLPHLKSLLLDRIAAAGNRLSFSPSSFPQLTQLQFRWVEELEEWEVGVGALPNLQSLEMRWCKKLKGWEVGDGALSNLQHLLLYGCVELNKLKNLPNSLTDVKLSHCGIGDSLIPELEKLPCLQKLKLKIDRPVRATAGGGGNKLSFSPGSFPRLAELDIEWLPNFELEDGALPSLQRLILQECNKLSNIPTSLTRVDLWSCEIGEASLLALEKLPRLQQLELIYPTLAGGGSKMSFSAGSFPHLTLLCIRSPRKLVELEVGDGALSHLQCLYLYDCSKLKKIPRGLPASIDIECRDPCIKEIEKYNTCPHFKAAGGVAIDLRR